MKNFIVAVPLLNVKGEDHPRGAVLGWSPACSHKCWSEFEMECGIRAELLTSRDATRAFYALAAQQLQENRGGSQDLVKIAEDAHAELRLARRDLEEHVTEHGC